MHTDAPTSSEIKPEFPGFRLPLNFNPRNDSPSEGKGLFRTALDERITSWSDRDGRMPMVTLRETAMLNFMNEVTDKQDWETKIFQRSITDKWQTEIMEQDGDFTTRMVDYCIEELKYKVEVYRNTGCINLIHGDVVKSDVAIPQDLREDLKRAVAPLEDVPDHSKDWHPGSDGTVLDLVHPSLFPLVYGLSRIVVDKKLDLETCLSTCGLGEIVPVPNEEESEPDSHKYHKVKSTTAFSRKFQWLPCDIDISSGTPKIASYINNLHPDKHSNIYDVLEKIIDKVIPLWNATLGPLRGFDYRQRVLFSGPTYSAFEEYKQREGPKGNEYEQGFYYRELEWIERNRPPFLDRPEPDTFVPPQRENDFDLKMEYQHRGLQVIVKLANIHLTPEKPEYRGGSWHVEGQMNEHICASAIYYYDNCNITPSRLAFRQASDTSYLTSVEYEQNDNAWLGELYGLDNFSPSVQNVGSVESREGRVITFPNILQHQVQPFKLGDPTKPGHRKILALFLVDPNIKIISTAHIPCQQKEWWVESLLKNRGPLGNFPLELRNIIVDKYTSDFPISFDKAKELREELMKERKRFNLVHDDHFTNVVISLCEH